MRMKSYSPGGRIGERAKAHDDCTVDDVTLVATYSPDQFAWALGDDGNLQVWRLKEADTHVEDRAPALTLAALNRKHDEFYRRSQ